MHAPKGSRAIRIDMIRNNKAAEDLWAKWALVYENKIEILQRASWKSFGVTMY